MRGTGRCGICGSDEWVDVTTSDDEVPQFVCPNNHLWPGIEQRDQEGTGSEDDR
jgi:hypothetical protein